MVDGRGGRGNDGRRSVRAGLRVCVVRTGRPARRTGPVRDRRAFRDGDRQRRQRPAPPTRAGNQVQTAARAGAGIPEERPAVPQRDAVLRKGGAVPVGLRAGRPRPVRLPLLLRPERLRRARVPGHDRTRELLRAASELPAVREPAGLGHRSRAGGS